MAGLECSVLALPSDLDLARDLAAAFRRVVDDCRVLAWQTLADMNTLTCSVAVFVTTTAGVAMTCEAVERLSTVMPRCSILVAGAELNAEQQLGLLAAGAVDVVGVPCRDDELKARLYRAAGLLPVRTVAARPACDPRLRNVVGTSAAFMKPLAQLPAIAGCSASVLVHGESGTGKEIFAQAIHYLSNRASQPWIAVNCGAIPAELVESELFGHVRGAFTTAQAARVGLVRDAEGGTLFLDDVDCLPLNAQSKLLRFLQEREYRQIGSNVLLRANVRIIAASNQSLRKLIDQSRFRLDLYFRLNVLSIKLPPLRERHQDIVPLALHFVGEFARASGRAASSLSPGAVHKLLTYAWPGNVRELRHVIERAVLLSRGSMLGTDDIDIDDSSLECEPPSFRTAKAHVIERFERGLIEQLLAAHGGNVAGAARAAGKNRRAFFALMQKYAISASEYRGV